MHIFKYKYRREWELKKEVTFEKKHSAPTTKV